MGGREGPLFSPEQRRARLPLPPNPPISLPHFSLPYKLTHSASHPLLSQPNGPSEPPAPCRGLTGTPRVGEIYLPIPHPGDMCSGEKNQQPDPTWLRAHRTAIHSGLGVSMTRGGSQHGASALAIIIIIKKRKSTQQTRAVDLLESLCFAFDWSLHRSPQRPFHPAADLRKKSLWDQSSAKWLWTNRAWHRVNVASRRGNTPPHGTSMVGLGESTELPCS